MYKNINDKIVLAKNAQKEWKDVSFEDRQKIILEVAKFLLDRKEECAKIITSEMNKPISQSIGEIEKCVLMLEYYAKCPKILQPEKINSEFTVSEIHFEPKGIILGVMPWNFPFWQVLRFAVPTLLSGNSVLVKHASICFGSGNAIERLFLDAGLPMGVFQNLEIGHKEVEEIIKNPLVQGVSLTGSEKAGALVASLAGQNIKKSLLELGGSDAFIVLDDADISQAAKVGALARLQNCGQTCVAAKRFIIQNSIYEKFLPIFIEEYKKYTPENPYDKNTKLSGMARPDLADELENQYHFAIENGAEVVLPLTRVSDVAFLPGLILVEENNPILGQELFGPLGVIMKAEDMHHALALANDIPFGLSNSVWTNDKGTQEFFIKNLESGTININRMTSSDPRFPFGGTKMSGYGTELSLYALREFVNIKTIIVN